MLTVALAHEWLEARSGSEKVFEALAQMFPAADLFALSKRDSLDLSLQGRNVATSFISRLPLLKDRRALTLPLMPLAWRWFRPGNYDVVVTSSHACAKGFWPARKAVHLCYCHTPLRYVWEPQIDRRLGRNNLFVALGLEALRSWDRRSVAWVDDFACNSSAVRARIQQFYDRDARVIHPPVDIDFFTPNPVEGQGRDFALALSRFVPYKRLDVAIEAVARLGIPLVVAGSGPEEWNLRALATRHESLIRFEIAPSDSRLRELYRRAICLVFPANEDFGIVAVEAQACGTPVIALNRGGAVDTVIDGKTGVLVDEQTIEAFAEALSSLMNAGFSAKECRANAERFATSRFVAQIREWVTSATGYDFGCG